MPTSATPSVSWSALIAPCTKFAFSPGLDHDEIGLFSTSSHHGDCGVHAGIDSVVVGVDAGLVAGVTGLVAVAAGLVRGRGLVVQEGVEVEAAPRPRRLCRHARSWDVPTRGTVDLHDADRVGAGREAVALEVADVVAVGPRREGTTEEAARSRGLSHTDNRSEERGRCGAEIMGRAEIGHESRPVGHPIAVVRGRRRGGDNRVLDRHPAQRPVELGVAVAEHAAVRGDEEVAVDH